MNLLRWGFTAFVAAFAFLLAPAVAADIVLTPPSGWRPVYIVGGEATTGWHIVRIWRQPGEKDFRLGQSINLAAFDKYGGDEATFEATELKGIEHGPGWVVQANKKIKLCGGHEARSLTVRYTLMGHSMIDEGVATLWNGTGYIATYVRPASQPPDPHARSSIVNLCIH